MAAPWTAACVDLTGPGEARRSLVTVDGDRVAVAPTPDRGPVDWLLVPGLSDAHVHVAALEVDAGADFLSCGVTHVRDVGGPLGNTLYWAQENEYPRVTHYGWAIDTDPPPPHAALLGTVAARSPASVVRHVERLARLGASGLKLYYGFPPPWVELAVRAAHDHGLRVAYHIGSGSHPRFRVLSVLDAVSAGVDSIEHIHSLTGDVLPEAALDRFAADDLEAPGAVFFRTFRAWAEVDLDGDEPRRLIDRFVERGAVFVPTLSPFAAMIDQVPAIDVGVVSLFRDHADLADVELARRGLDAMLEFVRRFAASGGRLAVGTDTTSSTGVSPRTGLRSEIGLLLRAGLAPEAVMDSASAARHRALGLAPAADPSAAILLPGRELGPALAALTPRFAFAGGRVVHASPT